MSERDRIVNEINAFYIEFGRLWETKKPLFEKLVEDDAEGKDVREDEAECYDAVCMMRDKCNRLLHTRI